MSRYLSGFKSRVAKKLGQEAEWTTNTWTQGAKDEYGKYVFTKDAAVTVYPIRVEDPTPDPNLYPWGEDRTVDVQLIVPSDTVGLDDIEDTTKKAPIWTSPQGVVFEAIALGREGFVFGWARIFLEKRRDSA